MDRLEAEQSKIQLVRYLTDEYSVASDLWQQLNDSGSAERKPFVTFQTATRNYDDEYMNLQLRLNRRATSSEFSWDINGTTGRRVSRISVSRRLQESGRFLRRCAVCISLNLAHARHRLEGCREHGIWTYKRKHVCDMSDLFLKIRGKFKRKYFKIAISLLSAMNAHSFQKFWVLRRISRLTFCILMQWNLAYIARNI